jgi:hypothetical protein
VNRPVAADCDEQRRALGRAARELREVARPLREQRLAAQAERRRPMRQLGPVPPGRAVLGGGIDQEDRFANGFR